MDENLSWRAKLAKSNINILNISWSDADTQADIYYEFMYHPKPGQTKWCKTVSRVRGYYDEESDIQCVVTTDDILATLTKDTLALRKELEG